MFSEEEWRLQENKFKAISFTKQQARTFNRLYFSGAMEVVPDRQGRILLPQYLKDFAEIKKEMIIVGVSNRIEIWASDLWQEFYGNSRQSFEEIAEKLIEMLMQEKFHIPVMCREVLDYLNLAPEKP